jgi:hypothetical protein
MTNYLNLCRACDTDFAGVAAFDRHRVGVHEYLFAEGLRFDPPSEDGRRCLSADEMLAKGMEVDPKGRWRISLTEADQERLQALKGSTESDSDAESEELAA